MPGFRFRLEPVLTHRRRLEDEQQVVFAAALSRLRDAEAVRDGYLARRDALRRKIVEEHATMDGHELRSTYAHCEYLDRALVKQRDVIAQAQREVDAERLTLMERTKDKKILETLREHRYEAFMQEREAAEQRESDETNSRRSQRPSAPMEIPS